MANIVNPFKPTRLTIAALIAFLWAVSFGAVRDFVWGDLREGLMDFRGLSRLIRMIIWLGFGLLAAMLGALLFNDVLRVQFSLIALPNASIFAPGRGILLPSILIPMALFFITIAWAFALTGAVHSHPLIKLGVLVLYLMTIGRQLPPILISITGGSSAPEEMIILIVIGVSILAVLGTFILRWARQENPALEFGIFLVLVGVGFGAAEYYAVSSYRQTGLPLGLASLQMDIMDLSFLVLPFLLSIGVDIADFTQRVSGWTTDVLTQRMPRWVSFGALIALVAWRIYGLIEEESQRAANVDFKIELFQYLGAIGELLVVGLVGWAVFRISRPRLQETLTIGKIVNSAAEVALPVIIMYNLPNLVSYLTSGVAAVILIPDVVKVLLTVGDFLKQIAGPWGLLVNAGAIIYAVVLARRGRRAMPLYLALFGLIHIYYELTNPGRILGILTWHGPQPVDFWWVLFFTAFGVLLTVRRKLNSETAARLFFLVFITFLLRQTGFISSPFSPLFGFAGVGFIAFGVVWDLMTAGSWANTSTPTFPRSSRIFLYLGYVLLTVTLVNWALTVHDLTALNQLTGNIALVGLDRFGRPLVYSVFLLVVTELWNKKSPSPA